MASPAAALSLYILTFNCGRTLIDSDAFASILLNGLPSSTLPSILVLSLQELAPISTSFLGSSSLIPYLQHFSAAVHKAAGNGSYSTVAVKMVGMTALMVFAREKERVKDLETAAVGLGVWDMGEKGGVGIRFRYAAEDGETELTFVGAHLRAMEESVIGRNEDWEGVVRRLVFSSDVAVAGGQGEERPLLSVKPRDAGIYKPTGYLFVAGDLNYRTSSIKPAPDDCVKSFPQPGDEAGSERHWKELFKGDQLNQEKEAGRTLHGLNEAAINFPPTYKYDVKKEEGCLVRDEDAEKWHWASHRWPSWCDRILYTDTPSWARSKERVKTLKYVALPRLTTSDHRPVALSLTVPLVKIPQPDEDEESDDVRVQPPYDIDINWRQRYDKARSWETLAGYALYLTTTWEGGMMFAASIMGGVAFIGAIRAMTMMNALQNVERSEWQ